MKISVLMCTYNGEKYVKEQLYSIINQTFKPNEIIIVDDNSKDNTVSICKRILEENDIEYKIIINKENKGYIQNFIDSLFYTTGDIIFLSDQDDIWKSNKIMIMKEVMIKKNALLLASNVRPLYMPGFRKKTRSKKYFSLSKVKKINYKNNIIDTPRPGCTFCISKELITNELFVFNNKIAHDLILWDLACLKNRCFLLQDKMISFRRHNQNTSFVSKGGIMRKKYLDEKIFLINTLTFNFSLSEKNKCFLNKQLKFFTKRKKIFREKKIKGLIYILFHFYLYSSIRLYFTDIYYFLKG